jgi:hypothetical protein
VVTRLRLLSVCRLAVRLAERQCPPPLPAGRGGAPRIYTEEALLLLALLRTLWRLSYQEVHDWLVAWPALALACGLPLGADGRPRAPSKAQQSKRLRAAGAPASAMLFVLLVRAGLIRMRQSATLRPTIRARYGAATGCTPCCAVGRACRSSSASPPLTCTMRPSLVHCSSSPRG